MEFSNYSFISMSIFFMIIINSADSKCQESFQCGFLGSLRFPFSDSQPECGFFVMNCSSPSPTIQLGNGRRWYRILQKLSDNRFRILDDPILLGTTTSCNLLEDDQFLKPTAPFISLTISTPNSTLFRCPYDPSRGQSFQLIDEYFTYLKFWSFSSCADFTFYYRNGSYDRETALPQTCVRLPFQVSENWRVEEPQILERYLAAEFDVAVSVSDACLECHGRGGQCENSWNEFLCRHGAGNRKLRKNLLAGGVSISALSATFLVLFFLYRKKYALVPTWLRRAGAGGDEDIELFFKKNENLAVRRYKYSDLKKMTKSFSDKLGQGGYGTVYKGKLPDGRLAAVKVLNESKENGKEFLNELASISRTSHVNIVSLLGFCFEGAKRALIYEFMPNGSLEKFILNTTSSSAVLGWEKLFEIAVSIARGLEYLHQGCNMRILHFDIKPHNILLDKDFNPKISDFGLAKLCPNRSSAVSMLVARGTIGYIAPELFYRNYEVSHKSDVYSYGMMVLEMAGETRDINRSDVDRTSEVYFPQHIYSQLEMEASMEDGTDQGSESANESQCMKRKLIIAGLWCIQPSPRDRPSMTMVVEMLEGKLESLQLPPKPYIFSPSRSTSRPISQYSTSETM